MPDAEQKVPERVNAAIPADIRTMFEWMFNYGDESYRGSLNAVAQELMRRGAQAIHAESLREAEPLDEDIARALGEHSLVALRDVAEGR